MTEKYIGNIGQVKPQNDINYLGKVGREMIALGSLTRGLDLVDVRSLRTVISIKRSISGIGFPNFCSMEKSNKIVFGYEK